MQTRKATNMSDEKFVLAIDEGTTSARAIIFNHAGQIMAVGQQEFEQIFATSLGSP